MKRLLTLPLAVVALSAAAATSNADRLRAVHANLTDELASNAFGSPVHLVSQEKSDRLSGDVYAVVKQPFPAAQPALQKPLAWCDILFLHLNIKYCRSSAERAPVDLDVAIGRKAEQALEDAHRMKFSFSVPEQAKDYLRIEMRAPTGPMSTHDYRISFEAVPLDEKRTFIHLSYAYGYGLSGRLAAQAYLGTIGRNKVGFTVEGTDTRGQPKYVGGMRGIVERNTMRYYLAVDSYLGSLAVPREARMEKSLRDWFAATERYPHQLREMSQDEYLAVKRREYQRIQS